MNMSAMQWTEVSRILYERTCNSYRVNDVTNEFNYLRERRIDSLQDLLDLSPDELKQFADFSRKGKVLSEEITKIQLECQKKESICLMKTHSPYWNNQCTYNHWLPVNQSRLLGRNNDEIENSWEEILEHEYKEFDTLCHVTHIDAAATIFEENDLKASTVQDNSVFSKARDHPNKDTKVLWFGPEKKTETQTKSKYGNVAFIMNTLNGYEGIMRGEGIGNAWHYYFVEVIDYKTQSACRILATTNTYPHLRPYNPTEKGGPWYYDIKKSKKHYWLRDIIRCDGKRGSNGNSLEIMREDHLSGPQRHCFKMNLLFYPIENHSTCIKHIGCRYSSMSDTALRVYIMYQAYKPVFEPFTPDAFTTTMKEICEILKTTCTKEKKKKKKKEMFLKGAEIAVNPRSSVDDIIGAMKKFPSLQELKYCLEDLE